MRYELNGKRLTVKYGGDVWEVEERDPYNWHLIRHGITISMPKLIESGNGKAPEYTWQVETFAQFKTRLAKMDAELLRCP